MILDARKHLGLTQKDRDIAAKKHEDYAEMHGILKQAIIVPGDTFSEHSVKNYGEKFEKKGNCETRYFQDISSAEKWLKGK